MLFLASKVAKLKKHRVVVIKEKLSHDEEYRGNDLVKRTPFTIPINLANVMEIMNI